MNFANTATWNYNIYSDLSVTYPVPFQRPCVKVCTEIERTCKGIYQVSHPTFPDCAATYDYSRGAYTGGAGVPFQYDNSSTCFLPADAPIAESVEPYLHTEDGVCAGFVETLYAPPGNKYLPHYALLQEPYAIQTLIERQLASRLQLLPPWLDPDCRKALVKYLCGGVYLRAESKLIRDAVLDSGLVDYIPTINFKLPTLLATSVLLPSYPQNNICQEYAATCANFIARANNPVLTPNCSALAPGSTFIRKFPEKQQLITTAFSPALGKTIQFYTWPNNMTYFNASQYSYEYVATCPKGYVIPEHPDNDQVQHVASSQCAVSCK